MSTVLVYKTDISDPADANTVVKALERKYLDCVVSIDLQDCDNVLRVEIRNGQINNGGVEEIVENYGFYIEVLH